MTISGIANIRVILALSIFTPGAGSANLDGDRPHTEDFLNQCVQQEQRSPSEQHTIDVLLDFAGTENCQEVQTYLLAQTELDLSDRQLSNLYPLASFDQLRSLRLNHNQITDLEPLRHLTQLEQLYLLGNQITDLSPMSELENLSTLYLDHNQIQDLSPLADLQALTILFLNQNQIKTLAPIESLPNLNELYLANNQIADVQPLRSLSQLTSLSLSNNQIENVESLSSLDRLVQLGLNDNQISQIASLSSLSAVMELDLRNNPLARKTCPIFPATACLFTDDAAELYQQGNQQFNQADFAGAIATFRSALEVYQAVGDRLRESDALDRIGNAYDELGQYANALDVYQQGAAIRKEMGDRQGEGESLTYLGMTYIRIGQLDTAIDALQQSWAIYQNLERGERSWLRPEPREGLILNGLALAYSKLEDTSQALRFAKLSLASYRRGNDRRGEAIALTRVGEAYLDMGNLDKARLYLEKALTFTQAQNDPSGVARSLNGLGHLYASQGEFSTALEQYRQAQTLRQTLGDAAGEGETLNAIGELLLSQGKQPQAASALISAIELWESLRPGLTDEDKISIAETQAHTYRLMQKTLIQLDETETALEISERGRARAFSELLAHRLALRGQSPLPEQFEPPPIEEMKQLARDQEMTLVEYAVVDGELYIWVIESTGALHFRRQPLDGKSLERWVNDTRLALRVGGRGIEIIPDEADVSPRENISTQTLRQLHQLLIEPIESLLPDNENTPVVIIPQDELFLVPFPALPDEQGVDLLEKHALVFAPAISLLTAPSAQSHTLQIGQAPALVVGNPLMPNDPATGSSLPPLLGAEQEALDIAPLLNANPLIGAAATKAAVVSSLSEVAIAHFATHGMLDDFGTGIPGALALTPTSTDTGFLTAAEIFRLPLAAQLVVLSACDTGRGNITGDGVVGLSRSFLTAGVESVVVSLWSVPDAPTALLMTEFYRQLQQNPNRAIALRQAMLATREQYPHPSAWAAFTLFGETGAARPNPSDE
ncbi:MAG: CHAT domain-containing protein [Elainellaceae cyanobacterium]